MTELIPFDDLAEPTMETNLVHLAEDVRTYVEKSLAASTRRAYSSDWRLFTEWCQEQRLESLPASSPTIALYIAHLVNIDRKMSGIERKIAAIRHYHVVAGLPSPTETIGVNLTLKGVRRIHAEPQQGKAPATIDILRQLVDVCPTTLIGWRDRALLLIGFAGAFRRSPLVALDVEDITFQKEGLIILIRKDKEDQEHKGRRIGIVYGSNPETCPVRTLRIWLDMAGITKGAIFRSFCTDGTMKEERLQDRDVARVVKRKCKTIGLDPALYAAHSLRAGFVTQAALNGVPERVIAEQTGHESVEVLRSYIRKSSVFLENGSSKLGL